MDADWFEVSTGVVEAQARGRAIVALETTVIAQGLPWPENVQTARGMEDSVRSADATPAMIA